MDDLTDKDVVDKFTDILRALCKFYDGNYCCYPDHKPHTHCYCVSAKYCEAIRCKTTQEATNG